MGCGSISSGDPCAITNYCMNSYLVLQVATAWARELASRFAFQEADWLRMFWDWLVLASDWLRDARVFLSCIGRVIAHNSLVCLNVSSCGGRGGHSWRKPCGRGDTWKVCCRCVSWSVWSARLTGWTSIHSLASCRRRASPRCESSGGPSGGRTLCTPVRLSD